MKIQRTEYAAKSASGQAWRLAAKNDQQAHTFVVNYCRKHSITGPVEIVNTKTGADLSVEITGVFTTA